MKLSLQMTIVAAAVFAAVCLGYAGYGFFSLSDITDPVQLSDAKGFAWFWTFLGTVAAVFGAASWWILRSQRRDNAS